MMRAALCISLAALLAGCAGGLPREVKVPVAVPCDVEMPKEPAWATLGLAADADIFDQVKALLAERRQRIAYQRQLEAAIKGCQSAGGAGVAAAALP